MTPAIGLSYQERARLLDYLEAHGTCSPRSLIYNASYELLYSLETNPALKGALLGRKADRVGRRPRSFRISSCPFSGLCLA